MGNFNDDRQVYAILGRLFQELLADAALAPQVQRLNGVVQFQHRNPNATITIKAVKGEEPVVDLGASDLRADLVVVMDADTAHAFWLGRVNAMLALSKGQIKAKGPVDKVLRLIALVKPVHKRYAQLLVELGAAEADAVGADVPVADADVPATSAADEAPAADGDAADVADGAAADAASSEGPAAEAVESDAADSGDAAGATDAADAEPVAVETAEA